MVSYYPATAFVPQFFTDTGVPLSGGTITAIVSGTPATPAMMYLDDSGTEAGAIITLNARGEPQVSGATIVIWLDSEVTYKFILKDASGIIKWTADGLSSETEQLSEALADSDDVSKGDAMIGVHRTITAAIATTVHSFIEAQQINVKADFGAKGDGTTDDSDAIRAAYSAVGGGATVYWPPGNYRLTKPIFVKANTRTLFAGGAFMKPAPIEDFEALPFLGEEFGYAILVNENYEAEALEDANLLFDGVSCSPESDFNGHVILTRMVSNLIIVNGYADSCADYNATLACRDVVVHNNWSDGMTNCAYDFWEGCLGVICEGNTAYNCVAGVNWNATDTYIEESLNARNAVIANNKIYGGRMGAIFVSPLSSGSEINDVLIVGNYIDGGNSTVDFHNGIVVQRSKGVVIRDNTFINFTNYYPIIVSVDDFPGVSDKVSILGNTFKFCVLGGNATYIAAFGTNHYIAENKSIGSSATTGMLVDSSTTIVMPNDLQGVTNYILNQTSAGTPTIPAMEFSARKASNNFYFRQPLETSGGIIQSVTYPATAAGTTAADAYQITTQYTFFNVVAAGTGAVLPATATSVGKEFVIWNDGANPLTVYARAGSTINSVASQTIAAGAFERFIGLTSTLFMKC